MHLAPLIRDLAVILGVAGLMSLIFQRIRQPVVLGYIVAGMIVGPYTPPFQLVKDIPSIQTWAELGVIFLMFSLGLEFSFRKLASVGVAGAVTAGAEVLFFLPVGYFVGKALGWSTMDCIFLGAMLAISSTTIIIKALDELKLKSHRFAELIFAALIVEDLIAILLLVGLTTVATSQSISAVALLMAALKLLLVVGGWFVTGYFILPRFMKYVGRVGNNEMLTLLSLGLCLGLVAFAAYFHYSTALGAFIMGSILAESPVLKRIEDRMEPIRDLFAAVFFVSIGMLIDPRLLWEHKGAVAILCVVTIVGKILSTAFGALLSGQTFQNSVRVGFGLAQIGEFSFIIATLGITLKATSPFLYPIVVAVSLVTTFTTPYLIRFSGPASEYMEARMPTRIRALLLRYARWSENRRTAVDRRSGTWVSWMRLGVNALVVTLVFVLVSENLHPYLLDFGWQVTYAAAAAWFAAVALASPFIWGMYSAFVRSGYERREPGLYYPMLSLHLSRGATLLLVSVLSAGFFPGRYVLLVTFGLIVILLGFFYRRLEGYYRWYERNFLSSFEEKETGSADLMLKRLAPWDAHLVRIEVHPNARPVRKRLQELALRNRYGVNVVAIQRGVETIIPPLPDEVILPRDELVVLGTDAQVDRVRREFGAPGNAEDSMRGPSEYELRHFQLSTRAPIVGQSIRDSRVRESYRAMVVGVERDGRRTINPDSDLRLEAGDVLWVVGEKDNLDRLLAAFH